MRITCEWNLNFIHGNWVGSCGIIWEFTDDGPEENGVNYCTRCGNPCVVVIEKKVLT